LFGSGLGAAEIGLRYPLLWRALRKNANEVTGLDKSDSLRDWHQFQRDDSEGANLLRTSLVGKQPEGSGSFAHMEEY
jgi:hypothetical protein